MDMEVLQQLFLQMSSISSDGKLKPVVIRSAGQNFSIGYDCSCHLVKDNEFLISVLSLGIGILQIIRNYDAPVVAYCNGYILGAGLELAMICDYVIGSSESKYGFPDVNFGFPSILIPPEGMVNFLDRKILNEISTGFVFNATESLKMGLINRIGTMDDAKNLANLLNNALFVKIKGSRFVGNEVIKSYVNYMGSMDTRKIKLKELEVYRKELTGSL